MGAKGASEGKKQGVQGRKDKLFAVHETGDGLFPGVDQQEGARAVLGLPSGGMKQGDGNL